MRSWKAWVTGALALAGLAITQPAAQAQPMRAPDLIPVHAAAAAESSTAAPTCYWHHGYRRVYGWHRPYGWRPHYYGWRRPYYGWHRRYYGWHRPYGFYRPAYFGYHRPWGWHRHYGWHRW